MQVVQATEVKQTHQPATVAVHAVRSMNFAIDAGAFIAFVGPSGSGKTTLLNMIAGLDRSTAGRVTVLGVDVATLDRSRTVAFRGENLGFMFQHFKLIPVLSVHENVEYPLLMVRDWPAAKRREQVLKLVDAVGMADQKVLQTVAGSSHDADSR